MVRNGKRFSQGIRITTCRAMAAHQDSGTCSSHYQDRRFSLLCYPVWGGAPFLSDLGVNPYELTTMSTPDLRRARLPHPVDSVATTRITTLVPHYPDRSVPLQVGATQPGDTSTDYANTTSRQNACIENLCTQRICHTLSIKQTCVIRNVKNCGRQNIPIDLWTYPRVYR